MHYSARRCILAPSLVLALLTALTALTMGGTNTSSAARVADAAFVHPQVREALAQEPTVRVIVTLREPSGLNVVPLDVAAVRAQVASRQAHVLASVPPGEFEVIYRYQAIPALAGRVSVSAVDALARNPNVVEIVVDGEGTAALAQSVPLINADTVHTAGVTGANTIVAVLDTGIDTNHADLVGDIAFEECFLSGGGCPGGAHAAEDDQGHGTNVSGIITSTGGVSSVGVAPDAEIAAYKILNSGGSGFFSDWTAALDDIIANHLVSLPQVNIVNMSLQSSLSCASATAMATAVTTLRNQGVPTFIASGNRGTKNSFTVPACIPASITVGASYDANLGTVNGWKVACSDATTAVDEVACWSSSDASLDLLAPGAGITSTGMGGGTSTFFGTSQASPTAAGVAALLRDGLSLSLPVDDVEARLKATGTPLTDDLDDGDPNTNRVTPRVDARVALLADGDDTDDDGCTNIQEYGLTPAQGGLRNPLDFWDVFDTDTENGLNAGAALTGTVTIGDIFAVAGHFGDTGDPGIDPLSDASGAGYHTRFDRGDQIGQNSWNRAPADGSVTIGDIFAVAAQFGLNC
jgi:subtilisin family serine protease